MFFRVEHRDCTFILSEYTFFIQFYTVYDYKNTSLVYGQINNSISLIFGLM